MIGGCKPAGKVSSKLPNKRNGVISEHQLPAAGTSNFFTFILRKPQRAQTFANFLLYFAAAEAIQTTRFHIKSRNLNQHAMPLCSAANVSLALLTSLARLKISIDLLFLDLLHFVLLLLVVHTF